jgi:hypothetical protein
MPPTRYRYWYRNLHTFIFFVFFMIGRYKYKLTVQ